MDVRLLALISLGLLTSTSCRRPEKFATLGMTLASPVDLAAADDGQHFYVLNSDFDNTYGGGSLVVFDRDGKKLSATPVPRMGRSVALEGNTLMVTVDYQKEPNNDRFPPHVLLFDLSNPEQPVLKKDFTLDCSPMNGVLRAPYLAVTCTEGSLLAGSLTSDLSQATLTRVRHLSVRFRALYIDAKRHLLFAFPTDIDLKKDQHTDLELVDNKTYSTTDRSPVPSDGGNEVPDLFENTLRQQNNLSQRQSYQYLVYDLAAESSHPANCPPSVTTPDCAFPERNLTDPLVQSELRWMFFNLKNFDGAPDQSDHFNDPNFRFYRSNFFAAQPDPDNPDVFYLSHRGSPDKSRFANQIVRVTILADLKSQYDRAKNTYTAPKTATSLRFERVYGFKGQEANKYVYPSDFRVKTINGQKTVVVNNMRDLVNWVYSDTRFSLGAQVLDQYDWFSEEVGGLSPKDDIRSYNQVALTNDGRGMSCSYYGNQVVLFDVVPGVGIQHVTPVK